MGYFPSGMSLLDYDERVCTGCLHNEPDGPVCPVVTAHMLKGYDEADNIDSILHLFIPLAENGLRNEPCRMRIEPRVERRQSARVNEGRR